MAKKTRTRSGRFTKGSGRKSAKRTTRKGTKRAARKRGTVTRAGIAKPLNLLAMVAGGTLAWHYRDDARLLKVLKDAKTRYLVMGGAGLALGSGMVAKRLKMPEPLRFALLGAGVAGAVAAVPVVFPKLLPAPKMQGMGRLTAEQMKRLQEYVAQQRGTALVNGVQRRGSVITGRGNVITGRMPGGPVITGVQQKMRQRAAAWR